MQDPMSSLEPYLTGRIHVTPITNEAISSVTSQVAIYTTLVLLPIPTTRRYRL